MSQVKKPNQKLWIVIKDTLSAYPTVNEAVDQFDNLAVFVTNDSKIIELTYSPNDKEQWALNSLTLKEIALKMVELKK